MYSFKKATEIDFTTQVNIFIVITIFQPFFVLMEKKFTILYLVVPLVLIVAFLANKINFEFKAKLSIIFLFFLFSLILSVLNSRNYIGSFIWISIWILYFLIYFWVVSYKEPVNLNKVISINLISGIIVAGIGILQYIFIQVFNGWDYFKKYILDSFIGYMIYSKNTADNILIDPGNWFNYTTGAANFRATSIFGGPSANGMFSAYIFVLAFTYRLYSNKSDKLTVAAIILSITNLLLTFGRSSWLNVFFAIITLIIFLIKDTKLKINKIINVKILAAFVIIFIAVILLDRALIIKISKVFLSIFNTNEMSNNGRIKIWTENLQLFANNPIVGYGIGNYSIAYGDFFSKTSKFIPFTAHNAYMLFLVETGFLGFSFFVALILYPVIMAKKVILKSISDKEKSFLFFFIASMIGIMIQFFFDYDFNNTRFLPLLFINMALVYRMNIEKGVEWND